MKKWSTVFLGIFLGLVIMEVVLISQNIWVDTLKQIWWELLLVPLFLAVLFSKLKFSNKQTKTEKQ